MGRQERHNAPFLPSTFPGIWVRLSVDETGLTGAFDFRVTFTQDDGLAKRASDSHSRRYSTRWRGSSA
jgi:hypothetical protein